MGHKDAKNDLQKIRDEAETHEPTLQIASPELTQATNTQEGKHGDPKDVETIPSPKEDDDGWGEAQVSPVDPNRPCRPNPTLLVMRVIRPKMEPTRQNCRKHTCFKHL